jgi:predicted DNA binding CopG/RHH family protein
MPSIPSLHKPSILRSKKEKRDRLTVQLSNAAMGALDERAAQESLPLAAVVRRSVRQLMDDVAAAGELPEVDLNASEDRVRTGRRGPATQWPERVSYVLPSEMTAELRELAAAHGVKVQDFVRLAVYLALSEPLPTVRPLRRTEGGFVTAAPPKGAAARARQTVDLLDTIRNRS